MAKPYSEDLRLRIKEAIDAGHTRPAVAEIYKVGIATVERYVARWKRTGSLKPDKFGGHQRHKLADHEAVVRLMVAEGSDQTLAELCDTLGCQGIAVSKSALDRFLKSRGLSYKKNTRGQRTKARRRGRRQGCVVQPAAAA